jgi:hypothetical protein
MAEIGCVNRATSALPVGQAMWPADHSQFSTRRCPQPQLRALWCRLRDDDWTCRAVVGRRAAHTVLCLALGRRPVPDETTADRNLRRRAKAALERTWPAVVPQWARQPGSQATVAVAAPGLAPEASRPFFGKRAQEQGEGLMWRHGLQGLMAGAGDRRVLVAQTARRGPPTDEATRRPRVAVTHQQVPLGPVLTAAACTRARPQQPSRHTRPAHSVMPAKRGGAGGRMQGGRAPRRQACPAHR